MANGTIKPNGSLLEYDPEYKTNGQVTPNFYDMSEIKEMTEVDKVVALDPES